MQTGPGEPALEPNSSAAEWVGQAAALRRATPADVPALRGVLARAFDQDPLIRCLVRQDERRGLRMEWLFEVMLRQLSSRLSETYTTHERAGAAVWKREMTLPLGDQLRLVPAFARIAGWARLPALLQMLHYMESLHARLLPKPHWMLLLLGVEPAQQRQGLGGLLLGPMLARCDRDQSPAYLETSRVENLEFYRRHGFEVVHVDERAGWPKVWFMIREPGPGTALAGLSLSG
jgi:ribosomal protein S18 acetylase RimI-like enzyme